MNYTESFHEFQSIALNHFDSAEDLLKRIDAQYQAKFNEDARLSRDTDILLGLTYALSTIEIGHVMGQVKSAVFRHNVLGAIGEITDCLVELGDAQLQNEMDTIISNLRNVLQKPTSNENHTIDNEN